MYPWLSFTNILPVLKKIPFDEESLASEEAWKNTLQRGKQRLKLSAGLPESLQCDIITALWHYLLNERY